MAVSITNENVKNNAFPCQMSYFVLEKCDNIDLSFCSINFSKYFPRSKYYFCWKYGKIVQTATTCQLLSILIDWRHDTQHNDTQHNDIPNNHIPHNDIEHNDILNNDIPNNDIQHNTEHNDIQKMTLSIMTFVKMTLSITTSETRHSA